MKECPIAFQALWKRAESLIMSDPSAQQAVAVRTAKGSICCFLNHDVVSGNTADEAAFAKALAESADTQIRYAVCMWHDSVLDVPSRHLRDLLLDLDPSNQEAEFLLYSGEGYAVKPLKVMIPPAHEL